MRTFHGVLVWLVVACVSSCDSAVPIAPSLAPQAPATPAPQVPATPAPGLPHITPDGVWAFSHLPSAFTTTDVYDAQEQPVRFTAGSELVWEDGTRHPGFRVSSTSNSVDAAALCRCRFDIRFGTRHGQRRAYLTADFGHWNDGTVVDLDLQGGVLLMRPSDVYPPGSFTLTGVVMEATPAGPVPVEGAGVSRSYGTGWQTSITDARGVYAISGLYETDDVVHISKAGFRPHEVRVPMTGDTTFDVVLVRF